MHPVRRIRDDQKSPPKSHDGEKNDLRVTNSHGLQGASLKSITLGREGRTRFFNLGSRSIVAFICWAATLMCELFEFTATTHQRRLSPPRAKKKDPPSASIFEHLPKFIVNNKPLFHPNMTRFLLKYVSIPPCGHCLASSCSFMAARIKQSVRSQQDTLCQQERSRSDSCPHPKSCPPLLSFFSPPRPAALNLPAKERNLYLGKRRACVSLTRRVRRERRGRYRGLCGAWVTRHPPTPSPLAKR